MTARIVTPMFFTTLLFTTLTAGPLKAQYIARPAYAIGASYVAPHHAATVDESRMLGQAAWMQAYGQMQLLEAQAAREAEAARKQSMENQAKSIYNAYALRAEHDRREAERSPRRLTAAEHAKIDLSRLPTRLTASELNPQTGAIRWPAILRQPEFAANREQFESLFARRAADRSDDSGVFSEAQGIANQMRETLVEQNKSMTQMELIQASHFTESLGYEARFTPTTVADNGR